MWSKRKRKFDENYETRMMLLDSVMRDVDWMGMGKTLTDEENTAKIYNKNINSFGGNKKREAVDRSRKKDFKKRMG